MRASIIIATYNKPNYLRLALSAYRLQSEKSFEIIIADDGSGEETTQTIEKACADMPFEIRHVWHEDLGFRKTKILNKASRLARSDYLIFTDDDVLPFPDFVEKHLLLGGAGRYVSAGAIRLPWSVTNTLLQHVGISEDIYDYGWLTSHGLRRNAKYGRFFTPEPFRKFLDHFLPIKRTFNGLNASVCVDGFLSVNGFDEDMGYGGEDVELGVRLNNLGCAPVMCRHRIRGLHLEHDRPYVDQSGIVQNKAFLLNSKRTGVVRTRSGLDR